MVGMVKAIYIKERAIFADKESLLSIQLATFSEE